MILHLCYLHISCHSDNPIAMFYLISQSLLYITVPYFIPHLARYSQLSFPGSVFCYYIIIRIPMTFFHQSFNFFPGKKLHKTSPFCNYILFCLGHLPSNRLSSIITLGFVDSSLPLHTILSTTLFSVRTLLAHCMLLSSFKMYFTDRSNIRL